MAAHQSSQNIIYIFAITKSLVIISEKLASENVEPIVSVGRSKRNNVNSVPKHLQFLLTVSPVAQYAIDGCGMETSSLLGVFRSVRNFGVLARRCLKLITAQQCIKECFLTADFESITTTYRTWKKYGKS